MRMSDWSSNVCSSDRGMTKCVYGAFRIRPVGVVGGKQHARRAERDEGRARPHRARAAGRGRIVPCPAQLGRASRRERVCQYVEISVVAVSLIDNPYHPRSTTPRTLQTLLTNPI